MRPRTTVILIFVSFVMLAACTSKTDKIAHNWFLPSDNVEFDFNKDGTFRILDKHTDKMYDGKWTLEKDKKLHMSFQEHGQTREKTVEIKSVSDKELVLYSLEEGDQTFSRVDQ